MSRLQTTTNAYRGAPFFSFTILCYLVPAAGRVLVVPLHGTSRRYLRANLLKLIQEPTCLD